MSEETQRERFTRLANEKLEQWQREGDNIDPITPQLLRLQLFIDVLAPEGSVLREVFETRFQQEFYDQLVTLDEQRRKSKLTAGVVDLASIKKMQP